MERTEIYNQFEELNKRASQGGGIVWGTERNVY